MEYTWNVEWSSRRSLPRSFTTRLSVEQQGGNVVYQERRDDEGGSEKNILLADKSHPCAVAPGSGSRN